jgi:cytochrome c biogenesis protein CcdA/preprotein translocase subunit Sec61beta
METHGIVLFALCTGLILDGKYLAQKTTMEYFGFPLTNMPIMLLLGYVYVFGNSVLLTDAHPISPRLHLAFMFCRIWMQSGVTLAKRMNGAVVVERKKQYQQRKQLCKNILNNAIPFFEPSVFTTFEQTCCYTCTFMAVIVVDMLSPFAYGMLLMFVFTLGIGRVYILRYFLQRNPSTKLEKLFNGGRPLLEEPRSETLKKRAEDENKLTAQNYQNLPTMDHAKSCLQRALVAGILSFWDSGANELKITFRPRRPGATLAIAKAALALAQRKRIAESDKHREAPLRVLILCTSTRAAEEMNKLLDVLNHATRDTMERCEHEIWQSGVEKLDIRIHTTTYVTKFIVETSDSREKLTFVDVIMLDDAQIVAPSLLHYLPTRCQKLILFQTGVKTQESTLSLAVNFKHL